MTVNDLIPILAVVTLGAVVIFAIIQMIAFLRKRRNREATKRALDKTVE